MTVAETAPDETREAAAPMRGDREISHTWGQPDASGFLP